MFARVTRVKGDPAKLEQNIEQLKAQLVPVFEQQPGYLGVISTANRETGEGATTTYWDSMEHLKASEAAIFAARDKFSQEQGAEIVSFHRCEIAVQERKADPKTGHHLRATTITGLDPEKIEAGIARYRTEIAPKVLSLPGAVAAVLFVDRENNLSFAVSSYESKEARDAAAATLDKARDDTSREMNTQAETQLGEVTHAAFKARVTS